MRYSFLLAAMLLSGCYVPPQDAGYGGYAQPGYVPAEPGYGYAQPGYGQPGYPPPGYDPNAAASPGYGYSGGAPTYLDGGAPVPLVLLGGQWGYYDRGRHWHRAPEEMSRHLEQDRREGRWSDHPGGPPHLEGRPDYRGAAPFRAGEPPRPAATPAAAPRLAAPPPPPARPEPHERTRYCPTGQHC